MIIDCREWYKLPDHGESLRRRVYVDGRLITAVWYVDTEADFVRTFDLMQNGTSGQPSVGINRAAYPEDWDIDLNDEVASRTIRGKVELFPLVNQCV